MKRGWRDVGLFERLLRRVGGQGGRLNDTAPTAGVDVANVELEIPGMICDGCAESIDDVLRAVAGVGEVRANVRTGRIRVSFDPERVDAQRLRNALTTAGYAALDVEGR